jgi:aspartate kinase
VEKMLVSGVAVDKSAERISILGLEDKPGTAFRVFDALAKANVNVDMNVKLTKSDSPVSNIDLE